ncbi:MAG: hypothetical protein LBS40_01635 [Burkholderiales bacterium]|nr:hypothetical protein [Burkholderiales bacterium]
MDTELHLFEKKLTILLEHTRALRMANEVLRKDLERSREEIKALTQRNQEAASRVEALMNHFPEVSAD